MLSLVVFLPLAGALALLALPNKDGSRDGVIRWGALAVSLASFATTLALWYALRPGRRRLPVRRARRVDAVLRHRLPARRRRHQPDAAGPDRLPDAAGAAVLVGVDRGARQGVLGPGAGARDGDDGRLRLARPVPVLRVLGRDADPDVLPHRGLGLRPARLRGGQVHALHDGRQRADADRHHRALGAAPPGDRRLHLRRHQALRPVDRARRAAVAVPGLRAGLRHQGAAVPVPHVAARRARPGADRRLGHPGRRAAEDGHLRPGALRLPAVPARGAGVRPVARLPRRRRHRLRRARGDGPAGHEEAGRLLERQPPRVRGAGHLLDERRGHAGRRLPDAGARRQHRRALHHRRHALGSPPHAPDRRVRRPEVGDAEAGRGLPDHHAVVDRPARPERLRRRVPDHPRRLPLAARAGRRWRRAASSCRPSTCSGCSSA